MPHISYDWRKGIQLVRHAKSRKRNFLFQTQKMEEKQSFDREEEDVAEILCAAQMMDLLGEKRNSRMDSHLKDVKKQQRNLFDMMEAIEGNHSNVDAITQSNFTVSSSQKLLADLKSERRNFQRP